MTPLRRFATAITPFIVLGACADLIGLSDYETGEEPDRNGGEGGEDSTGGVGGRAGKGGTAGKASGGSGGSRGGQGGSEPGGEGGGGTGATGGDAGEAGIGGEPSGGSAGRGGVGGRGGVSGSAGIGGRGGMGGRGGVGGMGGNAGSGAGSGGAAAGNGGNGGAGNGGSGGAGCSTVSLGLRNSGFDLGTGDWSIVTTPSGLVVIDALTNLGITAETFPNVAHYAGGHSVYKEMYQAVSLPPGARTATLTGYRAITTDESPTDDYDYLFIEFYLDVADANSSIGEFGFWSNIDSTNGWVQFTGTFDVSAHADRIVYFDIWGRTDSTLLTQIYVDSLSLTALVCP